MMTGGSGLLFWATLYFSITCRYLHALKVSVKIYVETGVLTCVIYFVLS